MRCYTCLEMLSLVLPVLAAAPLLVQSPVGLAQHPTMSRALEMARQTEPQTIEDQIRFSQIAAPTGAEKDRVLTRLGIAGAHVDVGEPVATPTAPAFDGEDHEIDACWAKVDIIMTIRRGPFVHVERIEIDALPELVPTLRRELQLAPGALFHETKLEESRRRMLAASRLRRIEIATKPGADDEHVVVLFKAVR